MTEYVLHPGEIPPDAVLRIRNPSMSWIAPRFSEPAREGKPILMAGEYWQVTRVDVDGPDFVVGLRLMS